MKTYFIGQSSNGKSANGTRGPMRGTPPITHTMYIT